MRFQRQRCQVDTYNQTSPKKTIPRKIPVPMPIGMVLRVNFHWMSFNKMDPVSKNLLNDVEEQSFLGLNNEREKKQDVNSITP